ncbi:RimK family alpha-L-glutamate ligase [Candidatus Woesearchaeota archaeon]|nr:RimK family alpha-L-glutamate ligase [Candidatus Woesearchaeota archaeon]
MGQIGEMKAAVISLGSISSQWKIAAMKNYFDIVDSLSVRNIEVNLGLSGGIVLHSGEQLKEYDCVYLKGSFRYAALLHSIATCLIGKTYLPIHPHAYILGHDKLLTQLKLQQANVPMPTTYIASIETSKEILQKITYPIVLKFPHGTQGKGVMFADSFSSASSMFDALSSIKQPFIIQEYVECNESDIRAIVVGDKVVASMKRKAVRGEKRANIHAGGRGESCQLDDYAKKIAVKAAQAVGAEISGVDILESTKGPLVIEVNVSPGIQGITSATNIDVADEIAKYLARKTKERQTTKTNKTNAKSNNESENALLSLGIPDVGITKHIYTELDMKNKRIMLPSSVTELSKFTKGTDVTISARQGEIVIMEGDKKEYKKA